MLVVDGTTGLAVESVVLPIFENNCFLTRVSLPHSITEDHGGE